MAVLPNTVVLQIECENVPGDLYSYLQLHIYNMYYVTGTKGSAISVHSTRSSEFETVRPPNWLVHSVEPTQSSPPPFSGHIVIAIQ